jgi:hypothetical protein
MKKSTVFLGCLLAIITNGSALAAPQTCTTKSLTFNCVSRGPITIVAIKANFSYMATSNNGALPDGAYKIVGSAYRFTSGGLQDKSIVQQQGKLYLVATKSEAKAAELAASDAAIACISQVR